LPEVGARATGAEANISLHRARGGGWIALVTIRSLGDTGLDDPVRYALTGRQQALGVHAEHCGAFRADVGPFAFLDDPADPEHWAALHALVPGRTVVVLDVPDEQIPTAWTVLRRIVGRQLVDPVARRLEDTELIELGDADVPAMLDLVNRTQPGPFGERTIAFGGYLGIRGPAGDLRAMAGRRMWAGDAIEVSAVQCLPPSEVRYSRPLAPSQPCRGSLKQAVCALAGVASRRQVCPPSLVASTIPPSTGISGPAPPTFRPPATATPSVGEVKCTDRITGHGSGRAVQCAPPSVVASRDVVPTAQPSRALMKSAEVRLSLPDN